MNEEPKDSLSLQAVSLLEFAEALGYKEFVTSKQSCVFLAQNIGLDKHLVISLHGMIHLHNSAEDQLNNWSLMDGSEVIIEVGGKVYTLPTYYARKAVAAKLVETVELFRVEEDGVVKFATPKKWVKFDNNSYWFAKKLLGVEI